MAIQTKIPSTINAITAMSGGDQQGPTPQQRLFDGPMLSASNLANLKNIQPNTTETEIPDSASVHELMTSASTNDLSETRVESAEPDAATDSEWADDDCPVAANYEEIDDIEELAHNILNSGLVPHCHPRIEALYRRAASGRGYHSQLIRASGLI